MIDMKRVFSIFLSLAFGEEELTEKVIVVD